MTVSNQSHHTSTARFIIGIEELTLTQNDMIRLGNPHVIGVILFSRNFKDSTQLIQLIQTIKAINPDLIISTDQEGGNVQRFKTDGFMPLPSLHDLAQNNTEMSIAKQVKILASDLQAHGVDFSFTPVVDLYNAKSRVIAKRAFASDPNETYQLAHQYTTQMHNNSLPSVLKHFPGHGNLVADSHCESAVDNRSLSEIEATDLLPFMKLITDNLADSIMIGHLFYPNIDKKIASLSPFWLTTYLRKKLDFKGIIFSDDFGMFAASSLANTQLESCQEFFDAGGDVALICNIFEEIDYTLKHFSKEKFYTDNAFNQKWGQFLSKI